MPEAITGTPSPTSDFFATQAAAQSAAATAAKDRTKADSDTFLTLLVAQMRYQNPLEPMKGTEFIAQSAQLATVEALQAIQAAQTSAQAWSKMSAAQQMLGTNVSAVDGDGSPVTGIATGVTATTDGPKLTLLTPAGKSIEVALDAVRSHSLLASAGGYGTTPSATTNPGGGAGTGGSAGTASTTPTSGSTNPAPGAGTDPGSGPTTDTGAGAPAAA